jgi:hypothetical protein
MSEITRKSGKKPFSKFNLDAAYRALNLRHLLEWPIAFTAIPASKNFDHYLHRLQQSFDLQRSEEGKKLIIDLILLEATENFPRLKVWKGGRLESEIAQGAADYLITENIAYIAAPMLCVVEAKKDDFEQGLAQCLVEMQACQWTNRDLSPTIEVFGIVTNAEGWKFYKLSTAQTIHGTELYALQDLPDILGILKVIFQACDRHLQALHQPDRM